MEEGAAAVEDAEFEKELDKAGSRRGALRRALERSDPEVSKLFSEMTPEQLAWGKLVGRIILAKSNDEVEDAFTWWKDEFNDGVELRNQEKVMAFFHAVGSLGCDDAHYRILRRMYIKANTNE